MPDDKSKSPVILIVDDDSIMRQTLEALILPEGYQVYKAADGQAALELAQEVAPDVILLDILMPVMDGFEVCRRIRALPILAEVPIVMITALEDSESKMEALKVGADDFLTKPVDLAELRARLRTITRLNRYRILQEERTRYEKIVNLSQEGIFSLDDQFIILQANPAALFLTGMGRNEDLIGKPFLSFIPDEEREHCSILLEGMLVSNEPFLVFECSFSRPSHMPLPVELHIGKIELNDQRLLQILCRDISERKLAESQLQHAYLTNQQSLEETITAWGVALEHREFERAGHTQRLIDLTVRTAKAMGFDEERLIHARRGAALHDIGKIIIPDGILLRPGILGPEESAIIRKHPIHAYEILSSIFFLLPATLIPLYHHERWDGSGYPQGLKGEDIPLEARIFAVVDVWDTLLTEKPFRRAWKETKVRSYIAQQAGTLFDPAVVEVFLNQVVEPGENS